MLALNDRIIRARPTGNANAGERHPSSHYRPAAPVYPDGKSGGIDAHPQTVRNGPNARRGKLDASPALIGALGRSTSGCG